VRNPNNWALPDLGTPISAPRRPKPSRRLIADPDEARRRALAAGLSPAEAEDAAQQALINKRHAEQVADEEDRLAVARRRSEREFWGLPLWED
jgi:hypothetical protein